MNLRVAISLRIAAWTMLLGYGTLAAEGPASFQVSEFTFQRPTAWTWVKTDAPMRAAQLEIAQPNAAESAQVVFYFFGPQNGGGTQANVQRWLSQFKESKDQLNAKVEDLTLNGRKVTFVQAQGTYMDGAPRGPKTLKPNFFMMAAILESKQGNVFVKMTGPAAFTKDAIAAFRKMVRDALN